MKSILIMVDMQKGFARYPQTVALTKKISSLLEQKLFDVVIATKFYNDKNSIYEKLFNWKRLETDEECALPESLEKNNYCPSFKRIIPACSNSVACFFCFRM